jgi:hypothetical protein
VVWPCKYDGLNKDTKRELELNFKEEVPVDWPTTRWFSHVL